MAVRQSRVSYSGGALGSLTTPEVGILRRSIDKLLKGKKLTKAEETVVEKADTYFAYIVEQNTHVGQVV